MWFKYITGCYIRIVMIITGKFRRFLVLTVMVKATIHFGRRPYNRQRKTHYRTLTSNLAQLYLNNLSLPGHLIIYCTGLILVFLFYSDVHNIFLINSSLVCFMCGSERRSFIL
jgi:hypothetical protein